MPFSHDYPVGYVISEMIGPIKVGRWLRVGLACQVSDTGDETEKVFWLVGRPLRHVCKIQWIQSLSSTLLICYLEKNG